MKRYIIHEINNMAQMRPHETGLRLKIFSKVQSIFQDATTNMLWTKIHGVKGKKKHFSIWLRQKEEKRQGSNVLLQYCPAFN